jgi:PEP-CTERM motif
MTKRAASLAFIGVLALSGLAAPSAHAAYVAIFSEVGANIVETGSGTIDLTDLKVGGPPIPVAAAIAPDKFAFSSGAPGAHIDIVQGSFSGPDSFGPGALIPASESNGDGVAIATLPILGAFLWVPDGYASGAPLSDSSVYDNATFHSLGLSPGAYVYSWGSGDHADTFTIQIGSLGGASPVPEASTWAMMLAGVAGLGYAALRRRRDEGAASA